MINFSGILSKIFPSRFVYQVEAIEINGLGKYSLGEGWYRNKILFSDVLSYTNTNFIGVIQVSTSINPERIFNIDDVHTSLAAKEGLKIVESANQSYCYYLDKTNQTSVWITGHKSIQLVISTSFNMKTEIKNHSKNILYIEHMLSTLKLSKY
jgi:hypothetical protein